MAATIEDISNMLQSEKLTSRKARTFAMPSKGFDGIGTSDNNNSSTKKNCDLALKLGKDYLPEK